MKAYDFDQSVGYWITITSHFYQQQLNEELGPAGITLRQFQVMAWLMVDGELTPTQLAERLMVEPPTLGGILDRMQREGWIERRLDAQDRRRRLVHLLPGASTVWEGVVDRLMTMRGRATLGLSAAEVKTLMKLLRTVHENLLKHRDEASSSRLTPLVEG